VQEYRTRREAGIGEARRRKHTDGNQRSVPLIVAVAMRLEAANVVLS
jgi:hypothetical protein